MASGAIDATTIQDDANDRAERYQQLATTLREWMNADDGYDDRVWPLIEESLQTDGIAIGESDGPDA